MSGEAKIETQSASNPGFGHNAGTGHAQHLTDAVIESNRKIIRGGAGISITAAPRHVGKAARETHGIASGKRCVGAQESVLRLQKITNLMRRPAGISISAAP